jgi:hypothetical protein
MRPRYVQLLYDFPEATGYGQRDTGNGGTGNGQR